VNHEFLNLSSSSFQKEKYHGDRTTKQLVKHALNNVQSQVFELWSGNFKSHMEEENNGLLPWLISFCGENGGR
jgi:hypothetical protein